MPIARDRLVKLIAAAQDYQQALERVTSAIKQAYKRDPSNTALIRLDDLISYSLLKNTQKSISTIAEEVRSIQLGKKRNHYSEELLPNTEAQTEEALTTEEQDLDSIYAKYVKPYEETK